MQIHLLTYLYVPNFEFQERDRRERRGGKENGRKGKQEGVKREWKEVRKGNGSNAECLI